MSRKSGAPFVIPARAERLMAWSLPPDERAAVLGDLEEEAKDIAEAQGGRAAARWYRRQVTRSLVPNVARRVGTTWRGWREVASLEDLERRRFLRRASVWFIGICFAPGVVVFAFTGEVGLFIPGAILGSLGVVGLFLSLFNVSRPRPLPMRVFVGWFGFLSIDHFGLPTAEARWVARIVLLALCLWPDRYWPSRDRRRARPEYWVRTPVRWYVGSKEPHVTTAVPAVQLAMSDIIVGRSVAKSPEESDDTSFSPMETVVSRTFSRADELRLYSAIHGDCASVMAHLEIRDSSQRVVRRVAAPLAAAASVRFIKGFGSFIEDMPATAHADPLAHLDVTLPLADLTPGTYSLRLIVSDGDTTNHRNVDVAIAE
jgi:hypothetical protein